MLKIDKRLGDHWPPKADMVAFGDRVSDLLDHDKGTTYHDRTREAATNIGDLLSGSMELEPAYEIADKLVADLDDPEQAKVFVTGLAHRLVGYDDYRREQDFQAGLEAIAAPASGQPGNGGAS